MSQLLLGDHLGSTTLVVDTSNPPQVIHRQYYKPYGEIAYTTGSNQTSIGYTGQRLDTESGLMYYGARYYDPVLSFFISADPVPPNKLNPKSRERYAYVLNNPLRYTDATGLSPDGDFDLSSIAGNMPHSMDLSGVASQFYGGDYTTQSRPEDPNAEAASEKENALRRLRSLGIIVGDSSIWTWEELRELVYAVQDLMSAAGWNLEEFQAAMGINVKAGIYLTVVVGNLQTTHPETLTNINKECADPTIIIDLEYIRSRARGPDGQANRRTRLPGLLERPSLLMVAMVQGLARAWDKNNGYRDSQWMGWENVFSQGRGQPLGPYTPSGGESLWAEAVAAYVYPNAARYNQYANQYRGGRLWTYVDEKMRR